MPSQASQKESQSENQNPGKSRGSNYLMDIDQYNLRVKTGEISKEESQQARIALNVGDLKKAVEEGRVSDVLLHGGKAGFMLHAKVDIEIDGEVSKRACILVLKSGSPRVLVNPQTTFRFLLSELGIKKFRINIKDWATESFYNRNQASVSSRELQEKIAMATEGVEVEYEDVQGISREQMKKSRGLLIKAYRKLYDETGYTLKQTTNDLLDEALKSGFIEKRSQLRTNTFLSWCDGESDQLDWAPKSPIWACKAAMNILIRERVYPNPKKPIYLAIYANLWFETRGPFLEKDTKGSDKAPSIRAAMASLPQDDRFPFEEIRPFLKAEIDWYKIVAARRVARQSQES